MKKLLIIICMVSCLTPTQANDIYFQNYGLKDGLSSNLVFGMVEDHDGALWLATIAGIDKFDGLNFKHYDLPDITVNGIYDYMQTLISSDSKGNIWVVTKSGLVYKYNLDKDQFEIVYKYVNAKNSEIQVIVYSFYIDNKDNILASLNHGLSRLDPKTFEEVILNQNTDIFKIVQDSKNNYYWNDKYGIKISNPAFEEIRTIYPLGEENSVQLRIDNFYVDEQQNQIWGVTKQKGIFIADLQTNEIDFPEELSQFKGLAIRAIEPLSDHELIFGVDGVGLVVWSIPSHTIEKQIVYQDGKKGTLSSNAIHSMYQTRDGLFIVATHRGGMNIYNPHKLNFGNIQKVGACSSSLASNYVLSMSEIAPGQIGFGTYEGISILNKHTGTWSHLKDRDDQISEVIMGFTTDSKRNIWALSFTKALTVYKSYGNGQYLKAQEYRKKEDISAKNVMIDDDDHIWVTNYSSLIRHAPEEGSSETFPIRTSLSSALISKDLLAVGTETGISFLNFRSKELINYPFFNKSKFEMRLIRSLRVDQYGRLWAASKIDGLFLIDLKNETIKRFSEDNGLTSNNIFGIAIENKNTWISTQNGISKIDSAYNITNYTTSDGILSVDFNYNAALCDSDGILYFGTNEGVITLNPQHTQTLKKDKHILFSEFRLNHKRILPGNNSPLKQATQKTEEIMLKYNQNSFSLRFDCIDFLQPGRGTFRWKLENFDQEWLNSSQLRDISYTNLNPGIYVFKVEAVDEKGKLISNEKSIMILITKPWWFSYWAYALYLILFTTILSAWVYSYRLRQHSKNSSERLGFLINLAHELKTPLQLVKAPLNDLTSNKEITGKARKSVKIALSGADKLHRQMLDFLDMGNLAKIQNNLKLEPTDIIKFIKDKVVAFKVLSDKKGIKLTFNYEEPELFCEMDRKLLDKILSNLISNALKYTSEGGIVAIELEMINSECSVRVSDTGMGIVKSDQKKIFKAFYRTKRAKESGSTGNGMGLVLASNFAKMLNGRLSLVKSSEKGTVFEFRFKYKLADPLEIYREIDEEIDNEENDKVNRILLVEDDEELLEYSISKLEDDFDIITANNGLEALKKCEHVLPNIIIADVRMPLMNGLQLCMNLKSNVKTCHIPIILFTGLDSKEEVMEGLEAGADDYVIKPFEFDILIKKIDALLNNRLILQKKFLYQSEDEEELGFASNLDDEWMNEVKKFVEEHIEDAELTPSVLYREFGMSRSAFYHKTKTLMDLSPLELIRTIRLKKSKTLLIPGVDISQVAYKIGFNNPKYFSRVFKKYFGQTPTDFISQKTDLKA